MSQSTSGSNPEIHEERVTINGRELVFETGRIAGLADGAVTVRYGDSLVLSTAEGEAEAREGMDFFPLTVDYEELASSWSVTSSTTVRGGTAGAGGCCEVAGAAGATPGEGGTMPGACSVPVAGAGVG